jgi:hypothetical protein
MDSMIHGMHCYGGSKGSVAEVGGVEMPSSGGARPHPVRSAAWGIVTPNPLCAAC